MKQIAYYKSTSKGTKSVYVTVKKYAKSKKLRYMFHPQSASIGNYIIARDLAVATQYSWPKDVVELSENQVKRLPKAMKQKIADTFMA